MMRSDGGYFLATSVTSYQTSEHATFLNSSEKTAYSTTDMIKGKATELLISVKFYKQHEKREFLTFITGLCYKLFNDDNGLIAMTTQFTIFFVLRYIRSNFFRSFARLFPSSSTYNRIVGTIA